MGATSASSWPALSNCCAGADAGCDGGGGVCADASCGSANTSATAKSLNVSLIMIASRYSPHLRGRFSLLYLIVLYPLSHRLAQSRQRDFRSAGNRRRSVHFLQRRRRPFAV